MNIWNLDSEKREQLSELLEETTLKFFEREAAGRETEDVDILNGALDECLRAGDYIRMAEIKSKLDRLEPVKNIADLKTPKQQRAVPDEAASLAAELQSLTSQSSWTRSEHARMTEISNQLNDISPAEAR